MGMIKFRALPVNVTLYELVRTHQSVRGLLTFGDQIVDTSSNIANEKFYEYCSKVIQDSNPAITLTNKDGTEVQVHFGNSVVRLESGYLFTLPAAEFANAYTRSYGCTFGDLIKHYLKKLLSK